MRCEICHRTSDNEQYFEKHHLFPGKHRRIAKDRKDDVIDVCRDCGDQIHLMFNNNELRTNLDSLEALKKAMDSFVMWVSDRPLNRKVSMKKKKRRL